MKRVALVLILLILVASLFVWYKSSKRCNEIMVDVSALSPSNFTINSYLESSTAFEYSSFVEMLFLENGTIRANETLTLKNIGNASTGKIVISYPYPILKIRALKLKNADVINASVSRGKDAIYLTFEPRGEKTAEIMLDYELNWKNTLPSGLGFFGALVDQGPGDKEEVILASIYFPSVTLKGTKTNNTLVLRLPKEWWAFVVDSSSHAPWKLVNLKVSINQRILRFEQESQSFPLIIIGRFNRFTGTISLHEKSVNVTLYVPPNEREEGETAFVQVEDIVETFSQWYGAYPYDSLNIVISRLIKPHVGLNIGGSFVVVSAGGFDVWLLSHEISHSWFGTYVDLGRMSESLATFSAMAYMLTRPEDVSFDFLEISENISIKQNISLARAYRTSLSQREMYPIVYRKGGFVFRSLQFVLGNETFFKGLRQVVNECHYISCGLSRIQEIFENVSNHDLDWFFDEWFYSAGVPDYEVKNLSIIQNNEKYILSFEIVDKSNFTMPLEVKVETDKGSTVKRIWMRGEAKVTIECEGKPVAVIFDPHDWIINKNTEYKISGVKIVVE
ncbi:hypothetical protein K1720_06385 [Thermococcus argininiproducens]|uniref:Peptidase M1 membrane alanine aminopeptidase domain-containing protein n=1 Tax=Thermococcus argininiproducens TaxID=2866384 RepID=A0A9E7M847_9EURY|nr:M1 family aminopeptidase [Thermococcus argininiproducens]USG99174.1 hypothetical protein K1720_06385 [Thermococcus argininiproducens]